MQTFFSALPLPFRCFCRRVCFFKGKSKKRKNKKKIIIICKFMLVVFFPCKWLLFHAKNIWPLIFFITDSKSNVLCFVCENGNDEHVKDKPNVEPSWRWQRWKWRKEQRRFSRHSWHAIAVIFIFDCIIQWLCSVNLPTTDDRDYTQTRPHNRTSLYRPGWFFNYLWQPCSLQRAASFVRSPCYFFFFLLSSKRGKKKNDNFITSGSFIHSAIKSQI